MFNIKFKFIVFHTLVYFFFAFMYYYVVGFTPEHFKLDDDKTQTNNFRSCLHHTLVTHSTVGYGEIYPRSLLAKTVNSVHVCLVYFLLSGMIGLSV